MGRHAGKQIDRAPDHPRCQSVPRCALMPDQQSELTAGQHTGRNGKAAQKLWRQERHSAAAGNVFLCRVPDDPPGGQSENQVDRKDEEQQHRTGRNQCPLLHLPGIAHLHDDVCRQHAEGGKQSPREYRRIARDHHHRQGLPYCASDCRNERCANAGVRDHYSSFRIPRIPQEGFALVRLL